MRDCGESNLQNMSIVNSMDSESDLAQSQDTPVGEVEPVVSAGSSEEVTEVEVTRQDSVGVESTGQVKMLCRFSEIYYVKYNEHIIL